MTGKFIYLKGFDEVFNVNQISKVFIKKTRSTEESEDSKKEWAVIIELRRVHDYYVNSNEITYEEALECLTDFLYFLQSDDGVIVLGDDDA